jgi:fibronectin-binding autotransporter adhesin
MTTIEVESLQVRFYRFFLLLMSFALPLIARAQLVADGQTKILDGMLTNVASGVTVGTNGNFTLLVLTNGAEVSNSASGAVISIGANASAQSNRIIVTGSGSTWIGAKNSFYVGQNGSANQLNFINGGSATNATSSIGENATASNNVVVVSGAGSIWWNLGLNVGNRGSGNALIITNGGHVISGTAGDNTVVGNSSQSANNNALISGNGSTWNAGYFYLGYISQGMNRLKIDNGGALISSSTCDLGASANSNVLAIADVGSLLQCKNFRIGYASTANQCIVSNGAILQVSNSPFSTSNSSIIEGTFTRAIITGAGSLWTNNHDFVFGQYSNLLCITAGGTLVDSNGYIENDSGFPSGKPNVVVVAGSNSLWKNLGDLHMMVENGQQLLITNGGVVADNYAYVDDFAGFVYSINPGIHCYVLVSGPGSLWTNRNNLYIGYKGSDNQLVVTDSGTVNANNLYFGNAFDRNQMVVSNSGIVVIRNQLQFGSANSKSNSLVISGGTVAVTNGVSLNNHASLTLNSGLFQAGFLEIFSTSNQFTFNGGTLQLTASDRFDSSPLVVGNGTNSATFEMLNSGSHIFRGGISISPNAMLKGVGIVIGNIFVNNGGTVAPGSTNLGVIMDAGNFTLNPGSTNLMKLNAHSGSSDGLTGITNLVYGGTLQLTNLEGSLTAGNSFKLFSATNYFGAFDNLVPATPGNDLRWDTNELNIDGVLRVFSATTLPPAFDSVTAVGTNLMITASGGISYDPCYLLTSTNLMAPLSNCTMWKPIISTPMEQ